MFFELHTSALSGNEVCPFTLALGGLISLLIEIIDVKVQKFL